MIRLDGRCIPSFGRVVRGCRDSVPRSFRQALEVLAQLAQREETVRRDVPARVENVANQVLRMGVGIRSGTWRSVACCRKSRRCHPSRTTRYPIPAFCCGDAWRGNPLCRGPLPGRRQHRLLWFDRLCPCLYGGGEIRRRHGVAPRWSCRLLQGKGLARCLPPGVRKAIEDPLG